MSYTCCSRNFSSRSLGDHLRYSGASCGSSFPSNLVYGADLCPRSSCQLGSSLYSQETCCEPIRTQTFRVVSLPCQTSCCRPRTPTFSNPCQTTLPVSLGFRSSSCSSLSSGSRSCYAVGCGPRGFRRLGYGICGFPSLGCGSDSAVQPLPPGVATLLVTGQPVGLSSLDQLVKSSDVLSDVSNL